MLNKLIMLSFLVGTVFVPALAARDSRPLRSFNRLLLYTLAFNVAYAFAVLFVMFRF